MRNVNSPWMDGWKEGNMNEQYCSWMDRAGRNMEHGHLMDGQLDGAAWLCSPWIDMVERGWGVHRWTDSEYCVCFCKTSTIYNRMSGNKPGEDRLVHLVRPPSQEHASACQPSSTFGVPRDTIDDLIETEDAGPVRTSVIKLVEKYRCLSRRPVQLISCSSELSRSSRFLRSGVGWTSVVNSKPNIKRQTVNRNLTNDLSHKLIN